MPGSVRTRRTAAAVFLLSAAIVFLYVAGSYVQVREMGTRNPRGSADVIVVMGAAQYDGRPSDMFERRLETVLTLWNNNRATWVAVTGGNKEGDRFTEAGTASAWLQKRGVPADRILSEETGTSTWDSLSALAPVMHDRGIRSAFLVTTDWHVARSVLSLRELGFRVLPAGAGAAQSTTIRWWRESLAVSVGRLIGFGRLHSLTG